MIFLKKVLSLAGNNVYHKAFCNKILFSLYVTRNLKVLLCEQATWEMPDEVFGFQLYRNGQLIKCFANNSILCLRR